MIETVIKQAPVVRKMRLDDRVAVYGMVHALAAHHDDTATLTLEQLSDLTGGSNPWITVLVATLAESPVGFAALCPLVKLHFGQRGMDLHHLYVAQPHRGLGIGRALVDAALAESARQGGHYMTVGTDPGNTDAQAAYTAMGFDTANPPGPRFKKVIGA
ncbi:GNAT family N-acetyltransferase [Actibacterium sp. 188UL27-1]|uniref:GNAT family N-acetyltransferase n=1 Tax=Actibacterium sp. 188UL27-1 TaxID=2786961 RepID=UPI00195CDECA|nr:GNAT family N-acetyltransferase [Actibacterium sp. 188UL27-1]MBM7066882.1 GNAT family N-acetyltransferase [Actibacterium sp. 188UL27-1]